MIRVRACTMRWRCHNSCRRSRFSKFGTQIGGKSFFSNKLRICCASCRSVFCLRPRFRRISDASPTLARSSGPPAVVRTSVPPTGFHADTHPLTRSRESTVELLRPLAMHKPLFLQLPSFYIDKSNLLGARMVITALYNDQVRLLSQPVGWLSTTNFTWALEPTLSWNQLHLSVLRLRQPPP
jgi:hypothetical protein